MKEKLLGSNFNDVLSQKRSKYFCCDLFKKQNKASKNVVESTSSLDNLLEHIIIDFSSNPKILGKELVEINPKVRILRVENENSWWLTRAYNFGCFLRKVIIY